MRFRWLALAASALLSAAVSSLPASAAPPPPPPPALDSASSREFLSGMLESFMNPQGLNFSRLMNSFEQASPCMRQCMPNVGNLLDAIAGTPGTDASALAGLCKQLSAVDACATAAGCSSPIYDLVAKMYQFTCVQKIEALGESLTCARKAITESRSECQAGCITDKKTHLVDPHRIPMDAVSLCESSVCLLGCVQANINRACQNDENSLFDSILVTSTNSRDGALSSLMQGLLPAQCRSVLMKQMGLLPNAPAGPGDALQPLSVGKPLDMRAADATSTPAAPAVAAATTAAAAAAAPAGVAPPPLLAQGQLQTAAATRADADAAAAVATPAAAAAVEAEKEQQLLQQMQAASLQLLATLEPKEAPVIIGGQTRTLQCQLLDWERRPAATPDIATIVRLVAHQLSSQTQLSPLSAFAGGPAAAAQIAPGAWPQSRAAGDDDEQPSLQLLQQQNQEQAAANADYAFARWSASLDRDAYKDKGYGAPAYMPSGYVPQLYVAPPPSVVQYRAPDATTSEGVYAPSWAAIAVALLFPLVVYVL